MLLRVLLVTRKTVCYLVFKDQDCREQKMDYTQTTKPCQPKISTTTKFFFRHNPPPKAHTLYHLPVATVNTFSRYVQLRLGNSLCCHGAQYFLDTLVSIYAGLTKLCTTLLPVRSSLPGEENSVWSIVSLLKSCVRPAYAPRSAWTGISRSKVLRRSPDRLYSN